MNSQDERELYLTEKIKNMAYNTKYKLMGYLQQYKKTAFLKPNQEIFILGQKFVVTEQNVEQVQQQVLQIFQNTGWLTYRSGFPQLYNELVGSYVSDTGWGCMVRVGQMLYVQVIKNHKKIQSKTELLQILQLFSDCDRNQPFSIHKIAKRARIQYGLKPGDWYNPSQISYVLSELHDEALAKEMKLKFLVFNSSNLFFDTIVKNMLKQGENMCKCQQKSDKFICQKCNLTQNSIALIVLSRLGLDGPQKKYLKVLQAFMEMPFCQGVIGGKPQKALYFLGKQDHQFIYLDPHYVQDVEKQSKADSKTAIETYFCGSFRKCKTSSIDSSVGMCFYLRDIKQLNEFYQMINKARKQFYQDFFVYVADSTPDYAKTTISKSILIQEIKDESFQML